MKAREILLSVKEVIKNFGDHKAISSYYLDDVNNFIIFLAEDANNSVIMLILI
jgi:hypothetical protein